ncbi:membrane protein [Arthrobacter phage Aoka]|nr:membrane protein [Arthrobacter phage Aoka]
MIRPRINGRRGAFQLVFGLVYLIVGMGYFMTPGTTLRDRYFSWLGPVPLDAFAALWVAAGAIAIVSAFLPRPRDAAGFMALVFAPGIWFGLFVIAAAVTGSAAAIVQAALYAVFSVAPLIVSGMQGPEDRDHREVR